MVFPCPSGKDEANHLGTFCIVWDAFVHPFCLKFHIKSCVIPDNRQGNVQTVHERFFYFYLADIQATFAEHVYFEVKVQPHCSRLDCGEAVPSTESLVTHTQFSLVYDFFFLKLYIYVMLLFLGFSHFVMELWPEYLVLGSMIYLLMLIFMFILV